MADPLSIAASIAGLVSLADTLFRTVIKFSREVKGAKQEITNLAAEVRDLSGVLHNLSLLASSLETSTEETVFRLHHVNSCRECIFNVQSKLSKEVESLERPRTAKSITRRLLWPFFHLHRDEVPPWQHFTPQGHHYVDTYRRQHEGDDGVSIKPV